MKVIIAGSRDASPRDVWYAILGASQEWGADVFDSITEVVSGGARGADVEGERFAQWAGLKLKVFLADWQGLGLRAGPVRNRAMAKYADACIVAWDGESRGTRSMIAEAKLANLRLYVHRFKEVTL